MPKSHPRISAKSLRLVQHNHRSFALQADSAVFVAEVLASDVFRARAAQTRRSLQEKSWAVVTHDWPPTSRKFRGQQDRVSLATSAGRLHVKLSSGAWELTDNHGLKVFTA